MINERYLEYLTLTSMLDEKLKCDNIDFKKLAKRLSDLQEEILSDYVIDSTPNGD